MYELHDYLAMIADETRTSAYLEAMTAVIRPGDHVLDLGTGFGFFAVHACRLGAAHVWAVEPNDAVAMGRSLAQAHGFADRITFIQDYAERVELPRRADVLVEDMRGTSALNGPRLLVLADAARRLLVPEARRVPLADELIVAPCEFPSGLGHIGHRAPEEVDGIAVGAIRRVARQAVLSHVVSERQLLAPGATWARLDFARLEAPHVEGEARFVAARDGALGGLASWFATELAPGVRFDSSPARGQSIYGATFLALAAEVQLRAGDQVHARLRARYDDGDYVWAWDVTVTPGSGAPATRQSMSNLAGRALSPARRARRGGDFAPARSPAVECARTLLEAVDGSRTLDEIARYVHARHAGAFADEASARLWAAEELARVAEAPPR